MKGNISIKRDELTNFYVPGLNKNYEILAITFLTAEAGISGGHYFTYVRHNNGWLNLNCLDVEGRDKITFASSYINNDFLKTMKVSYYGDTAYANMILLKEK
jgi:ubiquitin C-terminal hydrolase